MSALTHRIAIEHQYSPALPGCGCGETYEKWAGISHDGWVQHTAHVAEVTEAAVREQIAAEIETHMRRHDNNQVGFSAAGDAYAHAARIAKGTP